MQNFENFSSDVTKRLRNVLVKVRWKFLQRIHTLTLLVGWQEGHPACKKICEGEGGHWLVRMEWHPAGWPVCLPLLIFPCTIKSRSSLLALAHPGGPRKRAVKRLWIYTVFLSDLTVKVF